MEIDISEVYTYTVYVFYKYSHGNLCFIFKAKYDYDI